MLLLGRALFCGPIFPQPPSLIEGLLAKSEFWPAGFPNGSIGLAELADTDGFEKEGVGAVIGGLGAAMFPNGLSTDLKGEFASGYENILFFTSPFEPAAWDAACELLGGLTSAPGIPPGLKID